MPTKKKSRGAPYRLVQGGAGSSIKSGEESFKVKGEQLLAKVKNLIQEGNVRKISIKDKKGNVLINIPLTIGIVGAVLAPVLAAVGAIAALVTECTVSVERK
ncbi:DUF4342 domain-containing protein [Candidatus Collierbacteria bacterium]|nr:DUF4342 domain-containing protein [Candidatus Collierbacteria bacterium]